MVASRTKGESWAPRCVIELYALEQRSGELLHAFARDWIVAALVNERNEDSKRLKGSMLMVHDSIKHRTL